MRLILERSGGVAGLLRVRVVDADQLSAESRETLLRLARAAGVVGPAPAPKRGRPRTATLAESGNAAAADPSAPAPAEESGDPATTPTAECGAIPLAPAPLDSRASGTDRFRYRLTVETDGGRHTVAFGEGDGADALAALVEWLRGLPDP